MFASSSFTLPNLRLKSVPFDPEASLRTPRTPSISLHVNVEPPSKPGSEPQARKPKGSPQLNHWSRARALRSGRKLDRPSHEAPAAAEVARPVHPGQGTDKEPGAVTAEDGEARVEGRVGKSIYMVSDGTGWTVEHSVNAALGQFEHCLVDRGCPVNTHLFSGVKLATLRLFRVLIFIALFESLQ